MMHPLRAIATAVFPAAFSAMLCANATAEVPNASDKAQLEAQIARLVRQIGDPQFAVRQQASRELQSIGLPAKNALTRALTHPNAEVRYRARQILGHVLQADFFARLDAFTLEADPGKSYGLPCWEAFKKIAGDSPASRQLYVDAVRAEPALLRAADEDPRQAWEAFQARCETLINAANSAGGFSSAPPRSISTPRITALLICYCLTDTATGDAAATKVSQLFHRSKLLDEIQSTATDAPERRLVGAWIERLASTEMAFQGIWLGMRYDLPQALPVARSLLKRSDQQPFVRQTAIMAVAKLGGPTDVAILEPLLNDTAAWNSNDQDKSLYRCEVRDVALAAIIHLHGRDPKEFGFDKIQKQPQTLFAQNTMGFNDSASRAAAVARWKAWLAKRPARDKTPATPTVTQTDR